MAWPACGTTRSATAAPRWPTPSPPRSARSRAYSTFDPFTNEPAEALAEELRQIGPTPNARVFFTSSGSEAIDSAMKLARIAHVQAGQPQRKLIISRTRGYHGVAYGGTSAQGIAANKENFGPFVDEVVQVPADDVEAVATLMSQRGNEVAAIITEPVQGAGGVHPAARRLPAVAAQAVRPARRLPRLRRGHHRLRPHRQLVRRPPLRRHARLRHLRQGCHLRLHPARRRVRRHRANRGAGGRSRLLPAATASPTPGIRRHARPA